MTTASRHPAPVLRCATVLAAMLVASCASIRLPMHPADWPARLAVLQRSEDWQMQGRAAVVIGTRGWQASVDWRQRGDDTVVHLAGPLGIGASVLRLGKGGLSVNDAPASPDGVAVMQQRLGFDLPLSNLRYWLLGVPDPGLPSSLHFNEQGRAAQLTQAGWTVDFLRYRPFRGDWLPGLLVLTDEGVRVRIVVDRWGGIR